MIGPNGAGKTTLMAVAGAAAHPSEGAATILGAPLGAVDLRELRRGIGRVDATVASEFRPRATALEVALTGATATIVPRPEGLPAADRERASELVHRMGCGRVARPPLRHPLAGRAAARPPGPGADGAPRLLPLDEPTAGLDLPGREMLLHGLDVPAASEPAMATVQVVHHL